MVKAKSTTDTRVLIHNLRSAIRAHPKFKAEKHRAVSGSKKLSDLPKPMLLSIARDLGIDTAPFETPARPVVPKSSTSKSKSKSPKKEKKIKKTPSKSKSSKAQDVPAVPAPVPEVPKPEPVVEKAPVEAKGTDAGGSSKKSKSKKGKKR